MADAPDDGAVVGVAPVPVELKEVPTEVVDVVQARGALVGPGQFDGVIGFGTHWLPPLPWSCSRAAITCCLAPPGDNGVHEPVLQQELRRLEPLGQGLAGGLLHHPGPGKAHGGPGLGQDDVPFHGKAGGDPAGGGVGEDGAVEQPRLAVAEHRPAGLGHLHQGKEPLLHPGPAGDGVAHHRHPMFRGVFKEAGDLLPHGGAHAAHHEAGLHDEQAAGLPADAGGAAEDGLPLAADLAHGLQLFLVAGEVQGSFPSTWAKSSWKESLSVKNCSRCRPPMRKWYPHWQVFQLDHSRLTGMDLWQLGQVFSGSLASSWTRAAVRPPCSSSFLGL